MTVEQRSKATCLPIKRSVPLLCRSIYDLSFTVPNISLVKSKRVFWPPDYELTSLTIGSPRLEASEEGLCLSTSCFNVR